jgi:hypothetical protein
MINYYNKKFELLKLFFYFLYFLRSKRTILPLIKFQGNSLYAIANFINPGFAITKHIPYVPLSYKIKHVYDIHTIFIVRFFLK